ncbi:MAG: hypothetical protein M3O70_08830 [Actinomycetota bacterium]|nr:hypothetical protein [Actinomycetota bacterium]
MPPSSRVASLADTYLSARAERQRANDAFEVAQQELIDSLQAASLKSLRARRQTPHRRGVTACRTEKAKKAYVKVTRAA